MKRKMPRCLFSQGVLRRVRGDNHMSLRLSGYMLLQNKTRSLVYDREDIAYSNLNNFTPFKSINSALLSHIMVSYCFFFR